ncbi:PAP2 superfamily protein [Ligilactobacillus sp. WC1T17]|uniref:PAP2 superfamily protein n=1 Tax=Ligilactobacillus ruminis TaxID=1623 RepID=A0ABY1A9W1_9LACO|nr:PAP2 superfamily protein [Ligilactobacillus ruminis]
MPLTLKKLLPKYAILPLITVVVWNMAVYFGSRFFSTGLYHYNLTSRFDDMIPLVPWTVVIYLGCYLFWIVNYILSCQTTKAKVAQFTSADILGKTVCLIFYLCLPTTNIRPEITGTDFFSHLMLWLYQTDAADNLLPSIHCLISWLCFIGVRKLDHIPRWWKIVSLMIAILICLSTLTTKQHVIIDVLAGIFLAESCYFIAQKFTPLKPLVNWIK